MSAWETDQSTWLRCAVLTRVGGVAGGAGTTVPVGGGVVSRYWAQRLLLWCGGSFACFFPCPPPRRAFREVCESACGEMSPGFLPEVSCGHGPSGAVWVCGGSCCRAPLAPPTGASLAGASLGGPHLVRADGHPTSCPARQVRSCEPGQPFPRPGCSG